MLEQFNSDASEIAKFSSLAKQWWDLAGPCKPLHILNPVRLNFIKSKVSLKDSLVLDIGCGGGILAESMAKEGAQVTGIDLSQPALTVAQAHAKEQQLTIEYFCTHAEQFCKTHPERFDVVTCMELLEHVPDPGSLVQACAKLVKPQGQVFFSTVNRTLPAYLFAIVAAEYLTHTLPIGTHDYAKFIKPSELAAWLRQAELKIHTIKGILYNGISHKASLTEKLDINYILHAGGYEQPALIK